MVELYPRNRPIWTIRLRMNAGPHLETRYFRGYELPDGDPFVRSAQALAASYDFLGCTGLAALQRLLDTSNLHHLQSLLAGGDSARLGNVLFDLLFPLSEEARWRPTLNALVGSRPGVDAEPIRHKMRVRIVTTDPLLAGLPWRMTSYQGKWLIDHGWTFEVSSIQEQGPTLDLVAPCPFLILAPEYEGTRDLKSNQHIQDLKSILNAAAPNWESSGLVQIVRNRAELEHALGGMQPDVLYFYGHAVVVKEQLCLDLAGDLLSLDELNRLLRRYLTTEQLPRLAYLNGCTTAASGWHSAGHQLGPDIRLVVTHRTPVFTGHAAATARGFFIKMLSDRADPIAALHGLGDHETRRDYQWATLCIHSSYADSQISTPDIPRPDPDSADRLDRTVPKATADSHVTALLANKDRRVEALLAYGEAHRNVHLFGWQACDYLRREKKHQLHHIRVPFPADHDTNRLPKLLDEALRAALNASETEPLEQALRRVMPHHARVLWLEWTRERLDAPVPVIAWLKYGCDVLSRDCPSSLRIVTYLGMEISEDKHAKFIATVEDQHEALNAHRTSFGCTTLPMLPSVTRSDLINFFTDTRNTTCPRGRVHDAAKLIFGRCKGDYREAVKLIKQGEVQRWPVEFFERLSDKQPGLPAEKEPWD